jgi:hypothetical protein
MLDTLDATKTPTSVTWQLTIADGTIVKLTFHGDGQASDGKSNFLWSLAPSGDSNFPYVFIANEEILDFQNNLPQVYSGMINDPKGTGVGWAMCGERLDSAGKLYPFSMKKL